MTAAAQHPVDYDRFIISASARWRQAIYQGTEPFRSRANSLPGPFAPWPFRSLELSRRVYVARTYIFYQ